jgi:RNA polymerase sigma factor (sigma-70 family)
MPPEGGAVTPALACKAEKIAAREADSYAAMFPQLRQEDIAAVARETVWSALRDYDAARNPNVCAYLTQHVRWAILRYVEQELPPALRVFGGALRASVRHGERIATIAIPDDPQEAQEVVDALLEEHAGIFVGRLCADLRTGGGEEDGAIDQLDRARLLAAVDAALATLPGEEREAWERKYQHEQTHEEIAAALGVSVGTAQRRASAAMSKVRCYLRVRGMPAR